MARYEIVAAQLPMEAGVVRELFEEYQKQIGVDLCFQSFAEELSDLASRYEVILLLKEGAQAVGCAALGRKAERVAELKRLYVRPGLQGQGWGRKLAEAALQRAVEGGYQKIILDTIEGKMERAIALYASLGFCVSGRREAGGMMLLDMEKTLLEI